MKTLLFLLLSLILLTSCKTIVGDGNIINQNYGNYNSYQNIVIGKMITVNLAATTAGNERSVTISTDKNIHEYIDVIEKDNTLFIDVRKGYKLKTNKLNVDIFTPQDLFLVNKNSAKINIDGMEYMDINLKNKGSGKIIADVHESNVNVEQSGSGTIEVHGPINRTVNAKNTGSGNIILGGDNNMGLTMDNTSSGKIILNGRYMDIVIFNRGSGEVKSLEFSTKNASVINSGSGNCYINVLNHLNVNISSSGNVKYKGNPQITEINTGSGKLIKLE